MLVLFFTTVGTNWMVYKRGIDMTHRRTKNYIADWRTAHYHVVPCYEAISMMGKPCGLPWFCLVFFGIS